MEELWQLEDQTVWGMKSIFKCVSLRCMAVPAEIIDDCSTNMCSEGYNQATDDH